MPPISEKTHKYLCVTGDILLEEQPKVNREELVSYKDMEKQETPDAILSYAQKILQKISRYLSANQTSVACGLFWRCLII